MAALARLRIATQAYSGSRPFVLRRPDSGMPGSRRPALPPLTGQVRGRLVAAPPRVHHLGIADEAGVRRAQACRRSAEAAHEREVEAGALDETGGEAVVAAGALQAADWCGVAGDGKQRSGLAGQLVLCTSIILNGPNSSWQRTS